MRTPLHPMLRSLSLPWALGLCGGAILTIGAVSPAQAEHSLADYFGRGGEACTRLGRTWGIGWGDGYHTCRPRPEGRAADLPPATYYASPYAATVHFVDSPEYARLPWLAAANGLPDAPPVDSLPPVADRAHGGGWGNHPSR